MRDRRGDITRSDFVKLLRPVLKYQEGGGSPPDTTTMLPELTIVHLLKKTQLTGEYEYTYVDGKTVGV